MTYREYYDQARELSRNGEKKETKKIIGYMTQFLSFPFLNIFQLHGLDCDHVTEFHQWKKDCPECGSKKVYQDFRRKVDGKTCVLFRCQCCGKSFSSRYRGFALNNDGDFEIIFPVKKSRTSKEKWKEFLGQYIALLIELEESGGKGLRNKVAKRSMLTPYTVKKWEKILMESLKDICQIANPQKHIEDKWVKKALLKLLEDANLTDKKREKDIESLLTVLYLHSYGFYRDKKTF